MRRRTADRAVSRSPSVNSAESRHRPASSRRSHRAAAANTHLHRRSLSARLLMLPSAAGGLVSARNQIRIVGMKIHSGLDESGTDCRSKIYTS